MLVTEQNAAATLEKLSKLDEFVVDTETTGLHPYRFKVRYDQQGALAFSQLARWDGPDRLCGVSVRAKGESVYFPFRHPEGSIDHKYMRALLDILGSARLLVGFNLKFDLHMLTLDGMKLPRYVRDVMLGAHLMNENEPSHSLEALGTKYLGEQSTAQQRGLQNQLYAHGLSKGEMWKLPARVVAPYACEDVDLTDALSRFYDVHLFRWGMMELALSCDDYMLALLATEQRGLLVDTDALRRNSAEASARAQSIKSELQRMAGHPINLDSPKQLQAWLGVESTAEEELLRMRKDPRVGLLLDYRAWARANSAYYRKFAESLGPGSRLHPNFNQIGTISGRLSCKDPPMQALPKETDEYKVKDVFIADDDHVLVEADYSQAEIRVASHYANERRMLEKLNRGADIHSETATEVGIPRPAAKTLNFSVIYGIGAKTLSERLNVSERVAYEYLDKYHSAYPGFRALYSRAEELAAQRGFIRMFSGRLRHYNCEEAPTHKASSNLVQGCVAEMIRVAMTRLHKEMGFEMLLQVHDSIVARVRKQGLEETIANMRRIMEDQPWCTSVPLPVDVKTGSSLGAMAKHQRKG